MTLGTLPRAAGLVPVAKLEQVFPAKFEWKEDLADRSVLIWPHHIARRHGSKGADTCKTDAFPERGGPWPSPVS